jgi:hypothetical protein
MEVSTEFIKRVVGAMTRPPGCADCEGDAEQGWQVMPLDGIYGLCNHCANQHRQQTPDPRSNRKPQ